MIDFLKQFVFLTIFFFTSHKKNYQIRFLPSNIHNTTLDIYIFQFFKGRIYFDTPEGLKLAKISFEGADSSIVQSKIDKSEVNITVKQKNRKNLIKNSSPGSAEDIKCSTGTGLNKNN